MGSRTATCESLTPFWLLVLTLGFFDKKYLAKGPLTWDGVHAVDASAVHAVDAPGPVHA